jgi:hypothetical protein
MSTDPPPPPGGVRLTRDQQIRMVAVDAAAHVAGGALRHGLSTDQIGDVVLSLAVRLADWINGETASPR